MNHSCYRINIVVPVYNKASNITRTIRSVAKQLIANDHQIMITAVNDASIDNSLELLHQLAQSTPALTIVNLEHNQGRSCARNIGARAQTADFYIFLDADCSWESTNTLEQFIQHFTQGTQVCLGITSSSESDFWGRYFADLSEQRRCKPDLINHATTANFACSHSLFECSGGFPTEYKHYGFEDRDFLLCLMELSNEEEVVFDDNIVANNNDRTSLLEIKQKMMESGQFSAPIFKERHPKEYERTCYAKFDISTKNFLNRQIYRWASPLLNLSNQLLVRIFEIRHLSYPIKKQLVKACSALAYAHGTYLSIRQL